jgi:hypothetical protein
VLGQSPSPVKNTVGSCLSLTTAIPPQIYENVGSREAPSFAVKDRLALNATADDVSAISCWAGDMLGNDGIIDLVCTSYSFDTEIRVRAVEGGGTESLAFGCSTTSLATRRAACAHSADACVVCVVCSGVAVVGGSDGPGHQRPGAAVGAHRVVHHQLGCQLPQLRLRGPLSLRHERR